MACGPRTSQDPERMDLVRENQLRGCPSISLQRIWKIWQPNWGCRPDRLKIFRFERKVLSCQSGKSQGRRPGDDLVGGGVGDVVGLDRRRSFDESRQFSKNFRIAAAGQSHLMCRY